MIKYFLKSVILLSFVLLIVAFDVPPTDKNLFSIGRSKDANEIFYSINLNSYNQLNLENPIHAHWIKRSKNNKIEPLTWVQKKFAYGIVYLSKSDSCAKFRFAGYSKQSFELKKNKDDKFRVFTILNNREVEVNRVFIYITGGTFWIPEIPKVELYTTVPGTGKKLIETIIP